LEDSNHGLISIRPIDPDDSLVDDLIEHNPAFRALLAKSLASPREPYPFPATIQNDAAAGHSSS
jgi:hypothetical protein